MAALVVVVFHVLLISPAFDEPELGVRPGDAWWWFTHTPLTVLTSGREAVVVFFVLSGFVLALPATRGAIRWRSYYPQRLVRLYLPVWGSLVFALVCAATVTRVPHPRLSDWYNAHTPVQGLDETVLDAFLVLGVGWLNSPLWSLRWEVIFSLLLPLYVIGATVLRRLYGVKLLALALIVGAAEMFDISRGPYLPMFAFGFLLAFEQERIAHLVQRWTAFSRAPWAVLAVVCVLLLTSDATVRNLDSVPPLLHGVVASFEVVGAVLVVVLALHWPALQRVMSHGWVQWVGSRSFSLYLVHEPIVVSSASLLPTLATPVHLVIVLLVSLATTEGFFRAVERPAYALSRWASRRAGGTTATTRAQLEASASAAP